METTSSTRNDIEYFEKKKVKIINASNVVIRVLLPLVYFGGYLTSLHNKNYFNILLSM